MHLFNDRNQSRALVKTAVKLRVSQKARNFLTSLTPQERLLHGVY